MLGLNVDEAFHNAQLVGYGTVKMDSTVAYSVDMPLVLTANSHITHNTLITGKYNGKTKGTEYLTSLGTFLLGRRELDNFGIHYSDTIENDEINLLRRKIINE